MSQCRPKRDVLAGDRVRHQAIGPQDRDALALARQEIAIEFIVLAKERGASCRAHVTGCGGPGKTKAKRLRYSNMRRHDCRT